MRSSRLYVEQGFSLILGSFNNQVMILWKARPYIDSASKSAHTYWNPATPLKQAGKLLKMQYMTPSFASNGTTGFLLPQRRSRHEVKRAIYRSIPFRTQACHKTLLSCSVYCKAHAGLIPLVRASTCSSTSSLTSSSLASLSFSRLLTTLCNPIHHACKPVDADFVTVLTPCPLVVPW